MKESHEIVLRERAGERKGWDGVEETESGGDGKEEAKKNKNTTN